jgi:hypothetical protein
MMMLKVTIDNITFHIPKGAKLARCLASRRFQIFLSYLKKFWNDEICWVLGGGWWFTKLVQLVLRSAAATNKVPSSLKINEP